MFEGVTKQWTLQLEMHFESHGVFEDVDRL
jgi:hypothetical protein